MRYLFKKWLVGSDKKMSKSATYSEPEEEAKMDEKTETQPADPVEPETPAFAESSSSKDDAVAEVDVEEASPGASDESEKLITIGKRVDVLSTDDKEPVLQVAKRCHVGAIRERNEDSCLIFTSDTGGHFSLLPFGLYIVADGMGGHKNGHVASKMASRVAAKHIINRIYLPLLEQREGTAMQTPIQEVLTDAVQAAHETLYDPDPDKDSGTTLTAALILGRRLYVAHVGDTRVYLQADGKLEVITNDHSLVQHLQDVGNLSAEEATFYQYRHILLRAVGQEEEIEVDTYMRLLPKHGRLLLCTDGLSGMISHKTIQETMEQEIPLQQMADELFEAAMNEGGYDNITAVLVEFDL